MTTQDETESGCSSIEKWEVQLRWLYLEHGIVGGDYYQTGRDESQCDLCLPVNLLNVLTKHLRPASMASFRKCCSEP
jgi:hypothetical protein